MSAPERIVTRHYDNGIISAQPADKGFAYNGGNHTHEGQYVRADLSPAPDVAALIEAAKPLAEMAERYDPPDGDDDLECWSGLAVPKIKHIRALRAALAAQKGGKDND